MVSDSGDATDSFTTHRDPVDTGTVLRGNRVVEI